MYNEHFGSNEELVNNLINKLQTSSLTDVNGEIINLTKDRRDKMLKDGVIKIIQIPKFECRKIDYKEYLEKYNKCIESFPSADENISGKLFIDLAGLLERTHTSFISPGFYLNKYIENIVKYNIDSINRDNPEKRQEYIEEFNIYINAILISFKTLLDRLAPILSFFYNGISLKTTFGGRKSNGKYTGLMNVVERLKDKDEVMERIFEEYDYGIANFIKPRDTIIHYNDMETQFRWAADDTIFPIHYYTRIFLKKKIMIQMISFIINIFHKRYIKYMIYMISYYQN